MIASVERQGLVDRHLLGGGHRDHPGELAVGDRRRDRPALVGDRPDARDLGERPRRAQDADAVAGGGGVDDHEVVGGGAARAPLELRELPDLADAEQLAHPRRRHRERVEQAARAEHLPDLAGLDAQVLLHRVLGVDRDREQARGDLELLEPGCPRGRTLRCTRSWLPSSATIVRRPRRDASSPSAVATVDLPTPPLPVTKIRRWSRRPCTGRTMLGGDPRWRPRDPAEVGGCPISVAIQALIGQRHVPEARGAGDSGAAVPATAEDSAPRLRIQARMSSPKHRRRPCPPR